MSEILKIAHEMAVDLVKVGAMDAITMREVELLCLPQKHSYTAKDVKRIRSKAKLSQPVMAAVFNVSKSTVAQWERGTKKPSGASVRLLDLLDRSGVAALLA